MLLGTSGQSFPHPQFFLISSLCSFMPSSLSDNGYPICGPNISCIERALPSLSVISYCMALLEIKGVSKQFFAEGKEMQILQDINLSIKENEFVCFIGPSGCGKTTLLRIVAGLEDPTSGTITLDGELIKGPSPERGMVFQEYSLFPWRTVLDNIAFGLELRGIPANERMVRSRQYLKMVGLERFETRYPHELSGGMKQRVAIARALVNDPRALLMDEPFGALDAQTRNIMQSELLRIWSEEKKTVVFVTHSVDEAIYLADRIVIMSARPGRIKDVIEIPLVRPRNRTSLEVNQIRDRILSDLRSEMVTS
jgi:NitT/TauT family transport system ATP-binding protein